MSGKDHLLTVAAAYQAATNIKASAVSWRVFGDTKKLRQMQSGADIQLGRFERAMRWFSDNWPHGAKWPADVPRPAPAEMSA